MKGHFTFTLIKPEAVKNKHTGNILKMIHDNGFRIAALRMMTMSRLEAEDFYSVHKERPFFNELINFMISGPIVMAVLEKENAVEEYRKLMGATDPKDAEDNTLRKLFAISKQNNAIHGGDSDKNAKKEIRFFFSNKEIFTSSDELVEDSYVLG